MEASASADGIHASWRQLIHPSRVVLRASDPAASADYYAALTAMEIRDQETDRVTLGAADGGPVMLELLRAEQAVQSPRRAAGLFHTAFLYPDRRGLGAALKRVADGGFNFTGASDHLVSEALYLDDPDGIGIELYRDRPRSAWQSGPGGAKVAMDTIPLDIEPIAAAAPTGAEPAGEGIVIGHIHLKVADLGPTSDFWTAAVGLDTMAEYGSAAHFYASGGYHHHIGANTWFSAGQPKEPDSVPGLAGMVLTVATDPELEALATRLTNAGHPVDRTPSTIHTFTPDGIPTTFELPA